VSNSSSFAAPDGAALCLGVFDGVHKGHQALVARCVSESSQRGLVPLVHSFEPHPAAFFRQQTDHYLLTLPSRRSELLRDLGIAHAIYAEFNMQFAQQTPNEFLDHLVAHHRAKLVVTGPDYRFGKDRLGDVSSLRNDGRFEVVTLDEVGGLEMRYRSSSMREALASGDTLTLKQLTGRFFDFSGRVVKGQGRGRELGFATANLEVDDRQILPTDGVYAVRVLSDTLSDDGVMNIGRAPTVRGVEGARIAEVHLLDYQGDLYGQELRVELRHRIRGEESFDGLAALKSQIGKDVAMARRVLL
jgi:riboflavin kinase/FMN adenylyltransferase